MNLTNSSFSLRDYLAYLFPGVLLLGGYFLTHHEHWELLKQDKLLSSIVLLIGGYFSGYISNVFSTRTIAKILDCFFGNSFTTTLSKPDKNNFDQTFALMVKTELQNYWGKELVDAEESNLLLLCWRDIQRSTHQGIEYQYLY